MQLEVSCQGSVCGAFAVCHAELGLQGLDGLGLAHEGLVAVARDLAAEAVVDRLEGAYVAELLETALEAADGGLHAARGENENVINPK